MKALQVDYNKNSDQITLIENQTDENWVEVCNRFDDDVHRLRDTAAHSPFSGLYECFNEDNQPAYFLVEEGPNLKTLRQKVFLSKLGR